MKIERSKEIREIKNMFIDMNSKKLLSLRKLADESGTTVQVIKGFILRGQLIPLYHLTGDTKGNQGARYAFDRDTVKLVMKLLGDKK